jgi:hypothetical protein
MLLCLALRPAYAQLRFRADTQHGGLWRRVYGELPEAWKARQVVYVREITDSEMDRFVERFEGPNDRKSDSIVDGCYQADPASDEMAGRITLRRSLRGENAALVFTHEYGHYVWANVLSGADRLHYRRIWREQKRSGELVTEYAADSDEEGFAEAFAYFIRRPKALRRADARSWRFLTELEQYQAEVQP